MKKKKKSILLVEDDPMVQLVTLRVLAKHGHTVDIAKNGLEAIKCVIARRSKQAFDVILMDLEMPILNGYETSMELRNYGYSNPIVSFSSKKHLKKLATKFMDFSINKPLDLRELFFKLEKRYAQLLR